MPLICPACRKVHLKAHTDKNTGLEIDACPKCWGIWFDADELGTFFKSDQLKKRFFLTEEAMPLQAVGFTMSTRARPCPRCNKAMSEKLYGDVSIDICPSCRGIWLDDGELQRIVKHYYKGTRDEDGIRQELDKGLGIGSLAKPNLGAVLKSVFSFFGLNSDVGT